MLFIAVLFCILLGLVLYLFFAPVVLEISTTRNVCRLRFHRLFIADLRLINESIIVDLRILWFSRRIDLLQPTAVSEKKPAAIRKKNKRKRRRNMSWRKAKAILKSFKWNVCTISVDTGDRELNGFLFPLVFLFGRYTGKDVSINFIDETIIELEIENSLARMSWAYLRS